MIQNQTSEKRNISVIYLISLKGGSIVKMVVVCVVYDNYKEHLFESVCVEIHN